MKLTILLTTVVVIFALMAVMATAAADVVELEFLVEDWVVDFMRPTVALKPRSAKRQTPFSIPDANRKGAILVNGQYPGPTVEVFENDTVKINVINNLLSEATTIHWHGIHPVDTPWTDGTYGVSQAAIGPGQNFTYEFRAWPAGTHYWHSHMDAMQSAKGLRGPFIVKKREEGPQMPKYDEEKVLVMADEWRDPSVCLKLEGAVAGNDVCSDIDFGSLNGQVAWGNLQKFDKRYPYPLVEVEQGKCYRMRMIMMASNAENYIVTMAGHNMTLVALDGVDVNPIQITTLNLHIGERADVIVCADQDPGYYPMEMMYDYACTLTPGHFIPPGFHPVTSCKFYGFLHYAGEHELMYGPPNSPEGTGGGAPKKLKPVTGVPFDLTNAADYAKTHPVDARDEPDEPDARYMVTIGLSGPTYKNASDEPLSKGRWYMDLDNRRETWKKPLTPLLHTKGTCGAEGVPFITVPEGAKNVEVILNNVSPAAHNIHMHGMLFQVINVADFEWCNVNKTACFVMPSQVNPCPKEDRILSDPKGALNYPLDLYWGCGYNATKDKKTQNLKAPLRKDSFQVWQRSWAVIRFNATQPGVWQFHCHMEQHIPLGMVFAVNVMPSKQPAQSQLGSLEDVPTEGPCPLWTKANASTGRGSADRGLLVENEHLRVEVQELER